MSGVEVEVQSQLAKIVQDLENIKKASEDVSNTLKGTGENVGKAVDNQTKKVQNSLEQLKNFGRRVADQLKQDFMAMGSVASLGAGMKLSSQFSGSVKEAVNLSDTVRKLGSVFGIARSEFAGFQSMLSKGFGDIGASSTAAANAITGLSQTGVRGQGNLVAYAKTAAQLASIGGQQGQEGDIAKGMTGVISARGGNVNDMKSQEAVSREILQIRNATGASITDITKSLTGMYGGSNQSFQKRLAGGGSTTLATAAMMAPGSTAFIENYLKQGKYESAGTQARGMGNILGKNGEIDNKQIQAIMGQAKSAGGGDVQQGLKSAFGMSTEEAQGFIRLSEVMNKSGDAINGAHKSMTNINKEFQETRSLGDSFRANVNKVKGLMAPGIGGLTQGATDLLGKASQTTGGAVATTAGAGLLAAVLTGGGLRGIGGLLGGEAKSRAIEAATGEKVQKVEVINFPGGFGSVPSAASGIGGFLGKAGLVGAAGAAGYGVGTVANMGLDKFTQGKTSEGFQGNAMERLFFKLDQLIGGESAKAINAGNRVGVDVHIKEKPKTFQTTARPSRGTSQ
jgi:hypothetical protein